MSARLAVLLLVVFLTVFAVTQACRPAEQLQLPDPIRVGAFYQHITDEHASNATRLQERVESGEGLLLVMTITNIEDAKVQQHIQKPDLGFHKYVECKFPDSEMVLQFDKGDTILVYGNLSHAFERRFWPDDKAVRLKNCKNLGAPSAMGN